MYQIHYNALSMSEIIDILVNPQQQLWRSLYGSSPITSFTCELEYEYETGQTIPVILDEGDNATISFCFSRFNKI